MLTPRLSRKLMAPVSLAALLALALPVSAGELAWPIGCIPGIDCLGEHFRIGYPDIDRDGKAFNCGAPGYNGHTGTDIPVVSVEQGVAVLAAVDGEVAWTADGASDNCPGPMPDCDPSNISMVSGPSGEEMPLFINAGNFVLLRHKGQLAGYYTLYGHMRNGSVAVVTGQRVKRGEQLGKVGNSGDALVPHLHFGVLKGTAGGFQLADPWMGNCGPNRTRSLWSYDPPYRADITVTKEGDGFGVVTSSDGLINCGGVCGATLLPGSQVNLRAIPYRGSEFVGWLGACSGTAADCLVSLANAATVRARFRNVDADSPAKSTAPHTIARHP